MPLCTQVLVLTKTNALINNNNVALIPCWFRSEPEHRATLSRINNNFLKKSYVHKLLVEPVRYSQVTDREAFCLHFNWFATLSVFPTL